MLTETDYSSYLKRAHKQRQTTASYIKGTYKQRQTTDVTSKAHVQRDRTKQLLLKLA